ncbi:hypothetical protein C8R43DRAFT_1242962 [Mycena crocata]|nr:hypothetical protein C8R43DRAFT_1242962 [Mycena crocata]
MPVTRSCGLNFLRRWLANLTGTLTRYFRPVAPELPMSTLDVRTPNAAEIPSVPQDVTENEQLILSSHWQREANLLRFKEQCTPDKSGAFSDRLSNSQETTDTKAAELTSLFCVSPKLSTDSPVLSVATPPLIQMSPPSALYSPQMCPSLLDPGHASNDGAVTPDSRPASIGELGKRRGFKGAPICTHETPKRPNPSFLSLSSAFSPKTPLSPRPPSTPRTPLATVTNLMRTSTAKSPGKSSKPPVTPMAPPVSDELQKCYDHGDPFSVTGEAFYTPELVCASVPMSNLERYDAYRAATNNSPVRSRRRFSQAMEAASHTQPRIRETNVYDMMVYNYQPKVRKLGKKKTRPSRFFKLPHDAVVPTTAGCLTFQKKTPRVCLPRHFWRDCELSVDDVGLRPVPFGFSRSLRPDLMWDSQDITVNISAASIPEADSPPPNDIAALAATSIHQSLDVLLPLLNRVEGMSSLENDTVVDVSWDKTSTAVVVV